MGMRPQPSVFPSLQEPPRFDSPDGLPIRSGPTRKDLHSPQEPSGLQWMQAWYRYLLARKSVLEAFPLPKGKTGRSLPLILALYLGLTLLLTLPVILKMNSHLCGDVGDNYAFLWWLKWFSVAVTELKVSPFHSDELLHPLGASFLLNPTTLSNAVLSLPLQRAFSVVTTYNLIVLFSFWASAAGMYLLVFHLTGGRLASFLAGFLYAFSSYRFAHALGHLTTLSSEWLPLFLLYLIRSLQEPRPRNVLLASSFLVLNALSCWYYLIYCGLFLAAATAYFVLPWNGKESLRVLKTCGVVLLLGGLVLSPLILAMMWEKVRGGYVSGHGAEQYPADLLSFFVPSFTSTWGMLFYPVWSRFRANPIEGTTFVGYSVLALLLWGFRRLPVPVRTFWSFALGVFFLLSLGPYLNVGGRVLPIPMPYLFLHHGLPFFSLGGVPARFHIVTTACVAVLCGYVAAAALERARLGAGKGMLFKAGAALFGLLFILDHLHVPVFVVRHRVSSFYTRLGLDTEDYALIDLTPRGKALFCLTVHGKKMVGGYVARSSLRYEQFIEQSDVLRTVFSGNLPEPQNAAAADPVHARQVLKGLDVRYLIYPKPPSLKPLEKILEDVRGRRDQGFGLGDSGGQLAAGPGEGLPDAWVRSVEEVWRSAGWRQGIRLALNLRLLLASHPELLPSDNPVSAIRNSERIASGVWKLPVVFEDEEIRVYGVGVDPGA